MINILLKHWRTGQQHTNMLRAIKVIFSAESTLFPLHLHHHSPTSLYGMKGKSSDGAYLKPEAQDTKIKHAIS